MPNGIVCWIWPFLPVISRPHHIQTCTARARKYIRWDSSTNWHFPFNFIKVYMKYGANADADTNFNSNAKTKMTLTSQRGMPTSLVFSMQCKCRKKSYSRNTLQYQNFTHSSITLKLQTLTIYKMRSLSIIIFVLEISVPFRKEPRNKVWNCFFFRWMLIQKIYNVFFD